MRDNRRLLLCLCLSGTLTGRLSARDFSPSAVGTTGARFLEIHVDARAAAMGGAQGAVAQGAAALYHNPARLAASSGSEAAFTHGVYVQEIFYDYLAGVIAVSSSSRIGASLQHLSYGGIDRVDKTGTPAGDTLAPRDLAVTVGFGRRSGWVDVGGAVKYISSELNSQAQSFAADAGAAFSWDPAVFSLSASNLGPPLRYRQADTSLPTTFRLGSGLLFRGWKLAADAVAPRGAGPFIAIGTEYSIPCARDISLAARAGYNGRAVGSELGNWMGLSLGVGVRVGRFRLDYALAPMGALGTTHRVSLGLGLAGP